MKYLKQYPEMFEIKSRRLQIKQTIQFEKRSVNKLNNNTTQFSDKK